MTHPTTVEQLRGDKKVLEALYDLAKRYDLVVVSDNSYQVDGLGVPTIQVENGYGYEAKVCLPRPPRTLPRTDTLIKGLNMRKVFGEEPWHYVILGKEE